jgi:hypothetical protein
MRICALALNSDGRYKRGRRAGGASDRDEQEGVGNKHPDTLISMDNLASTYRNQGRWKEAEELEVQVMETFERVLGNELPSTLTSIANLASTYRNQGRWKEAEELAPASVADGSSLADVANHVLRRMVDVTADAGTGNVPQSQLNVAIGAITIAAGALIVAAKSTHNGIVANKIAQKKLGFDQEIHKLKEDRREASPARNSRSGNDSGSDIDDNPPGKSLDYGTSVAGFRNKGGSVKRINNATRTSAAVGRKPLNGQTSERPNLASDHQVGESGHLTDPTKNELQFASDPAEVGTPENSKCNAETAAASE